MRRRTLLAACGCCAALAACGGDDGPDRVLKDFLAAAEEGDNERACELLSKNEREFYELVESSCEESLDVAPNAETVDQIKAGRYDVERDRGRVIIRPHNGLGGYELVKEEGEWRVASSN